MSYKLVLMCCWRLLVGVLGPEVGLLLLVLHGLVVGLVQGGRAGSHHAQVLRLALVTPALQLLLSIVLLSTGIIVDTMDSFCFS